VTHTGFKGKNNPKPKAVLKVYPLVLCKSQRMQCCW